MMATQTQQRPVATGRREDRRLGGRIDYAALTGRAPSRQEAYTAAPVDTLLARLDGVHKAGAGWRARCPACGGQGRKVSVTVGDDGRVLLTCFSCHDTPALLAAVGLTVADLFERRITHATTPAERRALRQRAKESQWAAALGVLELESRIVLLAARELWVAGSLATVEDGKRLALAVERIGGAANVLREAREARA